MMDLDWAAISENAIPVTGVYSPAPPADPEAEQDTAEVETEDLPQPEARPPRSMLPAANRSAERSAAGPQLRNGIFPAPPAITGGPQRSKPLPTWRGAGKTLGQAMRSALPTMPQPSILPIPGWTKPVLLVGAAAVVVFALYSYYKDK